MTTGEAGADVLGEVQSVGRFLEHRWSARSGGRWGWPENGGNERMKDNGLFGGIYGMAFIGAAVYYVQHATTFWTGVLGVFKALFWPAMLMYKVLEYLKM